MKRYIMLFTCIFISFFCFSHEISFVITQDDGVQESVKDTTEYFEEILLEDFFENGHIVSNEAISLERNSKTTIEKALKNAKEGLFDYLICFYFQIEAITEIPLSCEYKLYDVKNDSILKTEKLIVPKSKLSDINSEKDNLYMFTREMLSNIYKSIK